MDKLFYRCLNLSSLPDISKWNTSNVIKMDYMFSNCEKLLYLPDISKWNYKNLKIMKNMFSNVKSLKILSNLSEWNLKDIDDKIYIDKGSKITLNISKKLKNKLLKNK